VPPAIHRSGLRRSPEGSGRRRPPNASRSRGRGRRCRSPAAGRLWLSSPTWSADSGSRRPPGRRTNTTCSWPTRRASDSTRGCHVRARREVRAEGGSSHWTIVNRDQQRPACGQPPQRVQQTERDRVRPRQRPAIECPLQCRRTPGEMAAKGVAGQRRRAGPRSASVTRRPWPLVSDSGSQIARVRPCQRDRSWVKGTTGSRRGRGWLTPGAATATERPLRAERGSPGETAAGAPKRLYAAAHTCGRSAGMASKEPDHGCASDRWARSAGRSTGEKLISQPVARGRLTLWV
jgi:hypothetical protein